MIIYDVNTAEKALTYLVDCTLATVEEMASKKSRSKCEYNRQISIAQNGINWMDEFGVSRCSTRAEDIKGSVAEWIKEREV